jgi:uncharacterized membrane protein
MFKVMERRLLRGIINPAMIATWVLGLWLACHGHTAPLGGGDRLAVIWRGQWIQRDVRRTHANG